MSADADVQITFGADTASLQSRRRACQGWRRVAHGRGGAQAQAMVAAGAAADAGMVAKLDSLTHSLHEAGTGAAKLAKEAHSGGDALGWFGSHASETFREVHAMGDELASGRLHQFMGSFSKLFFDFAAANPVIAAMSAAFLVAGGAAAYLAYRRTKRRSPCRISSLPRRSATTPSSPTRRSRVSSPRSKSLGAFRIPRQPKSSGLSRVCAMGRCR